MEKINRLKKKFKIDKIDGYIVPKNDEFFSEYISDEKDRIKYISIQYQKDYKVLQKAQIIFKLIILYGRKDLQEFQKESED